MTTEEFREQVLKAFSDGSKPVMSKREMFAAMAMQGMLANSHWAEEYGRHGGKSKTAIQQDVAEGAIKYADELLKQLES